MEGSLFQDHAPALPVPLEDGGKNTNMVATVNKLVHTSEQAEHSFSAGADQLDVMREICGDDDDLFRSDPAPPLVVSDWGPRERPLDPDHGSGTTRGKAALNAAFRKGGGKTVGGLQGYGWQDAGLAGGLQHGGGRGLDGKGGGVAGGKHQVVHVAPKRVAGAAVFVENHKNKFSSPTKAKRWSDKRTVESCTKSFRAPAPTSGSLSPRVSPAHRVFRHVSGGGGGPAPSGGPLGGPVGCAAAGPVVLFKNGQEDKKSSLNINCGPQPRATPRVSPPRGTFGKVLSPSSLLSPRPPLSPRPELPVPDEFLVYSSSDNEPCEKPPGRTGGDALPIAAEPLHMITTTEQEQLHMITTAAEDEDPACTTTQQSAGAVVVAGAPLTIRLQDWSPLPAGEGEQNQHKTPRGINASETTKSPERRRGPLPTAQLGFDDAAAQTRTVWRTTAPARKKSGASSARRSRRASAGARSAQKEPPAQIEEHPKKQIAAKEQTVSQKLKPPFTWDDNSNASTNTNCLSTTIGRGGLTSSPDAGNRILATDVEAPTLLLSSPPRSPGCSTSLFTKSSGKSGAVLAAAELLQRERLAKGTTNLNFLRKWLFLLEIRLSVFRGRVGVSGGIQKVDIRGGFRYTTELVAHCVGTRSRTPGFLPPSQTSTDSENLPLRPQSCSWDKFPTVGSPLQPNVGRDATGGASTLTRLAAVFDARPRRHTHICTSVGRRSSSELHDDVLCVQQEQSRRGDERLSLAGGTGIGAITGSGVFAGGLQEPSGAPTAGGGSEGVGAAHHEPEEEEANSLLGTGCRSGGRE